MLHEAWSITTSRVCRYTVMSHDRTWLQCATLACRQLHYHSSLGRWQLPTASCMASTCQRCGWNCQAAVCFDRGAGLHTIYGFQGTVGEGIEVQYFMALVGLSAGLHLLSRPRNTRGAEPNAAWQVRHLSMLTRCLAAANCPY